MVLEEMRWNGDPICPHCESAEVSYMTPANGTSRKTRTGASSQRRVWRAAHAGSSSRF
ncbi:MAG: transposase [Actinobacteria bacterium]|nr:transposase [Actinomycetota bacterium]